MKDHQAPEHELIWRRMLAKKPFSFHSGLKDSHACTSNRRHRVIVSSSDWWFKPQLSHVSKTRRCILEGSPFLKKLSVILHRESIDPPLLFWWKWRNIRACLLHTMLFLFWGWFLYVPIFVNRVIYPISYLLMISLSFL